MLTAFFVEYIDDLSLQLAGPDRICDLSEVYIRCKLRGDVHAGIDQA